MIQRKKGGVILSSAHHCTCLVLVQAAKLFRTNVNGECMVQSMHGAHSMISRIGVGKKRKRQMHISASHPSPIVLIMHKLDQQRKDAKWSETTWDPPKEKAECSHFHTQQLNTALSCTRRPLSIRHRHPEKTESTSLFFYKYYIISHHFH